MPHTRFVRIWLVLLFVCIAAHSQEIRSIRADFVFVQQGAPLQVVGSTMGIDEHFKRLIVANVSQEKILRAQLGWIVSSVDPGKPVEVFYGPPVDLNLAPSEIGTVGSQGATRSLTTEALQRLQYDQGILKIGVVYVKFENGKEWSHPLRKQRAFPETRDQQMQGRIAPRLKEFRERHFSLLQGHNRACKPSVEKESWISKLFDIISPSVYAQGGGGWVFVCSPAPRGCVNSQSECTTWICGLEGESCGQQCCALNLYSGQSECGPAS